MEFDGLADNARIIELLQAEGILVEQQLLAQESEALPLGEKQDDIVLREVLEFLEPSVGSFCESLRAGFQNSCAPPLSLSLSRSITNSGKSIWNSVGSRPSSSTKRCLIFGTNASPRLDSPTMMRMRTSG